MAKEFKKYINRAGVLWNKYKSYEKSSLEAILKEHESITIVLTVPTATSPVQTQLLNILEDLKHSVSALNKRMQNLKTKLKVNSTDHSGDYTPSDLLEDLLTESSTTEEQDVSSASSEQAKKEKKRGRPCKSQGGGNKYSEEERLRLESEKFIAKSIEDKQVKREKA
jgi:hypothetical protein